MHTLRPWMSIGCLFVFLCGCGGGGTQPETAGVSNQSAGNSTDEDSQQLTGTDNPLPTASIGSPPGKKIHGMQFEEGENLEDDDEDPANVLEPTEGSPEWTIREIAKLRVEPFPETDDAVKLRAAQKERNGKVLKMTTQVIQATFKDPERERLFDVAVHYMLETRLELALMGDRESVDLLYEDAESLWKRNRESKAASDAALTLVNLAYANARKTVPKDLNWLKEFARQANHFLASFPKEQGRSVPLVFTAARSCELNGLVEDAVKSYSLIKVTFPENPQAERVTGILRRLNLKGETVQLGGPTLDGAHVSIDEYAGKPVVVVFWSQHAKPFTDELSRLQDIQKRLGAKGVVLLGVCLDNDPAPALKFVKDNGLEWPQIFYTEEGKRGWNNPIVNYYGVLEVGNWLIGPDGKVISTSVKAEDLEAEILPLLKRGARRKPLVPQQ